MKSLFDSILRQINAPWTLLKAGVVAVLMLTYAIFALHFLVPLLRRFYIITFHWTLETSIFWTNVTAYMVPISAASILWLHARGYWGIIRKVVAAFTVGFAMIGLFGLLFRYQMVKDWGFFTAYMKWANEASIVFYPAMILTILALIAREYLDGNSSGGVFFGPSISPSDQGETTGRRWGSMKRIKK